jgi:hypothetical protein
MGEQGSTTTSGTDTTTTQNLRRSLSVAVAGVRQMRMAAQSGELVIDPATGAALQRAIADHMDRVMTWKQQATDLSTPLPLGANWVGAAMAGKFAGRAAGADNSLASVIDQYHAALTDAHEAVTQSMARYQISETGVGDVMKHLAHGEKGARLS